MYAASVSQMETIRINLTSHLFLQPVDESCRRGKGIKVFPPQPWGSKTFYQSSESLSQALGINAELGITPQLVKLLEWDLATCRISISGILHALISRTASTITAPMEVRKPFKVAAKTPLPDFYATRKLHVGFDDGAH